MPMKVCSRGHRFEKTSDCPVCPKCWSGYYRERVQGDFPAKLGAPALRALIHRKIHSLQQLSKFTEAEIVHLHGMGPKGIKMLKQALKKKKLAFQSVKK